MTKTKRCEDYAESFMREVLIKVQRHEISVTKAVEFLRGDEEFLISKLWRIRAYLGKSKDEMDRRYSGIVNRILVRRGASE